MNVMRRIREHIFGVSQNEMARIVGVNQSTVSRWESGTHMPLSPQLAKIRREAKRRSLLWDDSWFFEEA